MTFIRKNVSNLEINKITDNKLFWKAIKPLLNDKCIQVSTIALVNNTSVISDDSELAKTINSYFEKAVMILGIKECEILDANPQSRFQDEFNIAINKHKNHPSVKIINGNVSFERRFTFKETNESYIQNEISNLNPKKARMFGNIPTKVFK